VSPAGGSHPSPQPGALPALPRAEEARTFGPTPGLTPPCSICCRGGLQDAVRHPAWPPWVGERLPGSRPFIKEVENFLLNPPGAGEIELVLQIELSLEMEPESFRGAEVQGEAQRCVRGDAPFPMHDLVDPAGRNADLASQPVLADRQRTEEVFLEDLAGMDRGELVVRNESPPQ